jgi:hypothetical protein
VQAIEPKLLGRTTLEERIQMMELAKKIYTK